MSLYDLTKSKTRDDAGKLADPTDFDNNIAEALKRYSKHRTRLACIDISGTGAHDYSLPADWSDGLSIVVSIEYPVGDVPETLLDDDDWSLYITPTATKLRFMDAPTATVRLLYSLMHDEASVPAADLEAIANLSAAFCCRQLATAYGNTSDPTIQADSVNYRSKSDEYRRLADALEGQYKNHLGIKNEDVLTAGMAVAAPANSGRVRLTH